MPDTSSAQITIGGTLTTHAATLVLAEAVIQDGAGPNFEPFESEVEVLQALHAAAQRGEPLRVSSNAQPGGHFEIIERACRELGLSYLRADDGHYAYPPEHATYRPAFAELPIEAAGTIEQGPCLPLSELGALVRSKAGTADRVFRHIVHLLHVFAEPEAIVLDGEAADLPAEEPAAVRGPEAPPETADKSLAATVAEQDALLRSIAAQAFGPEGEMLAVRCMLAEAGIHAPV